MITLPLEQHRLAQEWLRQFRRDDASNALQLLRTLRLVSLAEFEESIQRILLQIVEEVDGHLGVFPIDKDLHSETRIPSSAHKIGYILTNLERLTRRHIRVCPSLAKERGIHRPREKRRLWPKFCVTSALRSMSRCRRDALLAMRVKARFLGAN